MYRSFGHHKSLSLPLSPKARPSHLKRKVSNASHSSTNSTVTSPRLTALRSRKSSLALTADPTMASQVVSQYILPMFEAETQLRGDISRSLLFGTSKSMKSLDPVPGTVYSELKLTEQLNKELAALKAEIKSLTAQLKEAQQRQESAVSDVRFERQKNVALEAALFTLKSQCTTDLRRLQTLELTETRLKQELSTLQTSYNLMEDSHKSDFSLLQAQYAKIDKLRNKALEQEHINSLLLMENDIIGERLKGLYFAIQNVGQIHVLTEKFTSEIGLFNASIRQLNEFTANLRTNLNETLKEKDGFQSDNFELVNLRNEIKWESDKIAKLSKEKIADLLLSLQKSEDEREKLVTKIDETDKTLKGLTDEYEKLRQKAKQYRLRRKQYGEEEEKVCKNCQRVFIESENFNWSCRRHQNEYSGEIYWCCGKSNRDAPGCKTSKHESKEDDEDEDANQDTGNETTQRCASCRKYGHTALDCPKDPNCRTAYDINEELQRITDIHQVRNKVETQTESTQALNLLLERAGIEEFHREISETISISDDSESDKSTDKDEFREIRKIKKEVEFDQRANLMQVEDFMVIRGKDRKSTWTKPDMSRIDKKTTLEAREYLEEVTRTKGGQVDS